MNWNLFTISTFTLAITSFVLTVILLVFGKSRLHRIWGWYNLFVGIWGIGGFLAGFTSSPAQSLGFWKLAHLGVISIPVLLLHGIILFCNIQEKRAVLVLRFSYIFAILFVLLISDFGFFSGISFRFNQFYYPILGPVYYVFLLWWILTVIFSQAELLRYYSHAPKFRRLQIRYLFWGLILGFSGGVTNFLPGISSKIYPFGNFGITLYSLVIVFAIFRHRLLDVSLVLTRAAIFVAVYSIILGVPFASAFVFRENFQRIGGANWWFFPLILSTSLGTLGPILYLYIDKKAEDKLLGQQKGYQNILMGASSGMIRIKDLDKLLNLIVRVLTKTVRIRAAEVFLLDANKQLYLRKVYHGVDAKKEDLRIIQIDSPVIQALSRDKDIIVYEELMSKCRDQSDIFSDSLLRQMSDLKAALIIPSLIEDRIIGLLLLGDKKTGELYSLDDLRVFRVLANQAALAIENAQFYEEIRNTHEQLFQAEKLATIGTMADGLSHQINNRFHAMSLIAGDSIDAIKTFDLAKCDDETKKLIESVRGSLERIEANVLQGGEVVKGLLKYSRPGESGFEPVDFRDVIKGSIDMVQYKIKLKEIDLLLDIPDNLPRLSANLTQLQEVFFNLIDNAYDAIKERQVTLEEDGFRGRISISAIERNGSIEVVVEDNGMGVKESDKKKLFTPFFTTKATAKKGTGLGLYVIEKIVAAHKGRLSLVSDYRSFTKFVIHFPMFNNS